MKIKTIFVASLATLSALALTACSTTTAPGSGSATSSSRKVAVLTESPEGDPWADLVSAGALKGAGDAQFKRIAGVQTTAIDQQIRNVASSGYNPVVVLQDNMATAVNTLATSFPDTRFIVVDSYVKDSASNVTTVTIDATDTAYLAGAVAGLTSKAKTIGFVGGADVPIIGQFLCGFKGGVAATAPGDQVTAAYAGTFTDPSKGQAVATQLYNGGVDVIFQAAALTGLGVLKAAGATGKQAIGVDTWQGDVAPGHVVWSALKDGSGATASAVSQALRGTLKSGAIVWSSADGAKLFDERDLKSLSAEDQAKVTKISAGLADGSIKPSC